jgi:putative addiction module component (TIGR02574 family)
VSPEIGKLELSQKLLLDEDIWDGVAASNCELPMPQWQEKELDQRYAAYQQGKLALHDWMAVHEDLRNKSGRGACPVRRWASVDRW